MSNRTGSGQDGGTPLWVKVAGVVTLLAVLLVVVVAIAGRGGHGPRRHAPTSDPAGGHTGPPPGVTHTQP